MFFWLSRLLFFSDGFCYPVPKPGCKRDEGPGPCSDSALGQKLSQMAWSFRPEFGVSPKKVLQLVCFCSFVGGSALFQGCDCFCLSLRAPPLML